MEPTRLKNSPGPFALADCPTLKIPPQWDEDGEPYWTIHSQADADLLKTCSNFTGVLIISSSKASSPLIVDGPKHIKGKLKVDFVSQLHPRVALFSMKSLVSVDGEFHLSQGRFGESRSSNLTMLDFPVLRSVGRFFHISSLPEVHTINMPCLERATTLWLTGMQSLHTLHVPKLQFVAILRLIVLPSLKTLSFDAGLRDMSFYFGCGIEIWETALESLSGLHFTKTSIIEITSNKNLTSLSFPFLKVAADKLGSRVTHISLQDNGENFHLDLPRLKGVKGPLSLSNVRTVHIPELRHIDNDLDLGARRNIWHLCRNCSTTLTTFSAPKLTKICGSLNIGTSPQLTDMKFPYLKAIGGDLRINNTAAVNLQTGIEMPRLRRVHSVQIIGTEPYCEKFDGMRERGVIRDRYWCGTVGNWTVEELRKKLWSDMQEIYGCDGSSRDCCVFRKAVIVGFAVKIGCVLTAFIIVWYMRRRYRRRTAR